MGNWSIPVIGLTGGVGSGKSRVARILEDQGCLVANADKLAAEALESPHVRASIKKRWGDGVDHPDGSVNREAIAHLIFDDEMERRWLESIIHPMVEQMRTSIFDNAPEGTRALVIDAPLLLEADLGRHCDSIVFVDTPVEIRRERVLESRQWDSAELDRREAAQLPLDAKRSMSHHVLCNDGEVGDLTRSVEQYLDDLINDYSSRPDK